MNFLENGSVLPFGLLQCDYTASMRGFNKTYKSTQLRMGIVMNSYPIGDPKNVSGLTTEYDVVVNEQDGNSGAALSTYKNCITVDALGSIADFFEKTFRTQKKDDIKGNVANTKGQNGAIVLILCLDAMSEKGVVIGGITHPDRKTTLKDNDPHLEGEFNGINIKVEKDGSTTLTFKGATDNDGNVIDSSQGNTEVKIEQDGSYQFDHKTITQRFDKSGVASLTTDDNIENTTQKSFNVTTQEDSNLSIGKNLNITATQMAAKISGSCSFECQSGTISSEGSFGIKVSTFTLEAESLAQIKAPIVVIEGQVALGGDGGLPVLTLATTFIGTGNLGIPVISRALAGFATRVTAQ